MLLAGLITIIITITAAICFLQFLAFRPIYQLDSRKVKEHAVVSQLTRTL